MAREHGLCAQLDALSLRRENWYIADLPVEVLRRAQAAAGERASPRAPLLEATMAMMVGRGGLPLRRRLLRLPVWLVPCPEAQLLLLDWAWTGGGRPSKILSPLADALAAFDLTAARKLVFAQMLVDSQQSSASQLPVLIRQRNDAAIAALQQALADDCSKVAVVYGE